MRKILLAASTLLLVAQSAFAQSDDNFDKKFRFGLRVTPQPTWLSSNDNNTKGAGSGFGFGFGLITEFKLSDIVHFSTGIGGDFEKGKLSYRQDPAGNYTPGYVLDNDGALVEANNGTDANNYFFGSGHKNYLLRERTLRTTYVTIPLTLKLLTQELSGFRYFGQFGGELGFRVKTKADDDVTLTGVPGPDVNMTNSNLNVGPDASLVPARFGLNVGAGAEYRLAGTTSLFLSVNYFRSFTNTMRKDSKYVATDATFDNNGNLIFTHLKQGIFANAIRINIGVLF